MSWAVVEVRFDKVQRQLSGPLPHPLQTVPAGELHAATEFLKNVAEQGRLGYDCDLITVGIRRGRKWCEAGSRRYADLWRTFWQHYARV